MPPRRAAQVQSFAIRRPLFDSRGWSAPIVALLLISIGASIVSGQTVDDSQIKLNGNQTEQPSEISSTNSAEQLQFFEAKIRPVLIEHCYECHSDQRKGGLAVDSRAALLQGGDSGAAVVPGDAMSSLLMGAIRYEDFEMPPAGKLPPQVISDFEQWIAQGAVDPRDHPLVKQSSGVDITKGKDHWSYQPIATPQLPSVKHSELTKQPLDHFVLARLEQQNLTFAEEATKEELIRRLSFDLTGLPPTPAQIDAFLNDNTPNAYEHLVEQLLDSPRFGERWGRHWLDVVRFGESLTLRGFVLDGAWRYRDYVIDSFNADRPVDEMIVQHIAGDLIDNPSNLSQRQDASIATTFLAMGNHNLEEQDKGQLRMDIVDEQLDTIGQAFLAQTLSCARCHDHKFDPIPTRDYYALAGILRSTKTVKHSNVSNWLTLPLPISLEENERFTAIEQQVAHKETELKKLKSIATKPASRGKLDAATLAGVVIDDDQAIAVGQWTVSQHVQPFVAAGYRHDENSGKGNKTLTFHAKLPATGRYEVRLSYTPSENRSTQTQVTVFGPDGEKMLVVNQRQPGNIDGTFHSLGEFHFEESGQSYVLVSNQGSDGHVIADAVQFIPFAELAKDATEKATTGVATPSSDTTAIERDMASLETELKGLKDQLKQRPTYVGVTEEEQIEDAHIHVRGVVQSQGAKVPRGFLQVASFENQPQVNPASSGRVELARWIADVRNPLTSRVYVNRCWHWLMGRGISSTPDNFGTTGETPDNLELLDYLATQFTSEGWSTKKLVRQIVLSRTYRQSSRQFPSYLTQLDPDNRLMGRANRRKLEAECLYDSITLISGSLDLSVRGLTIADGTAADYGYQHKSLGRAIYLPAFRNSPHEFLEAFDMADSSRVTGVRNNSTVAPQALVMMNSPFVLNASERAANQLSWNRDYPGESIDRLFRTILGRLPTQEERTEIEQFMKPTDESAKRWPAVVQSLFASIDFRYLD